MTHIYLDSGVLGIYFSIDCTSKVTELMNRIQARTDEAHVLKPVLCEAFFNICKIRGKDQANQLIRSFTRSFPVIQIDLDDSLILFTGLLKCQHRGDLSFIDCMSIAYSINNKIEFHTTEKKLKQILPEIKNKLKIITYQFK